VGFYEKRAQRAARPNVFELLSGGELLHRGATGLHPAESRATAPRVPRGLEQEAPGEGDPWLCARSAGHRADQNAVGGFRHRQGEGQNVNAAGILDDRTEPSEHASQDALHEAEVLTRRPATGRRTPRSSTSAASKNSRSAASTSPLSSKSWTKPSRKTATASSRSLGVLSSRGIRSPVRLTLARAS